MKNPINHQKRLSYGQRTRRCVEQYGLSVMEIRSVGGGLGASLIVGWFGELASIWVCFADCDKNCIVL